jgi:hypothetical protein
MSVFITIESPFPTLLQEKEKGLFSVRQLFSGFHWAAPFGTTISTCIIKVNMKRFHWCIWGIILTVVQLCFSKSIAQGLEMNFNENLLFSKGERLENVTQQNFDDSGWQKVNLPHDWAFVNVRTDIENHQIRSEKISNELIVYDHAGKQVTCRKSDLIIPVGNTKDLLQSFTIKSPKRWDITDPKLYSLHTIVSSSGKILDTHTNSFGIGTFRFTPNDGFHLNGHRLHLFGVNLHHDHGSLGAAFYRWAMERQLEIMKEMGCNAIRTNHNPPSPEMLDLCDRMGFIVWNEAFYKWDDKADRLKRGKSVSAGR